jgi:hypothetical protein
VEQCDKGDNLKPLQPFGVNYNDCEKKKEHRRTLGFEDFTMVTKKNMVFWVAMLHSLQKASSTGAMYCLHFQR